MLDSLPVSLFLGTVLGFLSGLGIGGGSLLVLWLTVVLGIAPETARGVNLLFFIPSALVSIYFRRKQGVLELKSLLPAIAAGCIAAALFSWIGTWLETGLLKKLFGGLLVAAGLRELFYKQKQAP